MIFIAASATGGHLYPAIALAQELEVACMILTEKRGVAKSILAKYSFPHKLLSGAWISLFMAAIELFQKKPSVLVLTGGQFTIPLAIVAFFKKIPIVLLEQNTVPGRANKVLQYLSKRIFLSFEESQTYIRGCEFEVSGNPVRKQFASDEWSQLIESEYHLPEKTVVVLGGSQGAQALNQWIKGNYRRFINSDTCLIHITGTQHFNAPQGKRYTVLKNSQGEPRVFVFPYFEKMDLLYKRKPLVVCRAGATTIAELLHFKCPSVLVPYPFAKDNHQEKNALSLDAKGLGKCVLESALDFEDFWSSRDKIISIQSENLAKTTPPQARQTIAERILTFT